MANWLNDFNCINGEIISIAPYKSGQYSVNYCVAWYEYVAPVKKDFETQPSLKQKGCESNSQIKIKNIAAARKYLNGGNYSFDDIWQDESGAHVSVSSLEDQKRWELLFMGR